MRKESLRSEEDTGRQLYSARSMHGREKMPILTTRMYLLDLRPRRVSTTILDYSLIYGKVVWSSKYETGGFGRMVGSPNFHHKPPEPGYIDV